MPADSRDLVQVLKSELEFLESGGYRNAEKSSWRAQFIFEDSSACINFPASGQRRPCTECILMQFVPAGHKRERIPCRFIPLNEDKETLDSLYRTGTAEEIEAAVVKWLKTEIHTLTRTKPNSPNTGL
jgi:hypothetical protein